MSKQSEAEEAAAKRSTVYPNILPQPSCLLKNTDGDDCAVPPAWSSMKVTSHSTFSSNKESSLCKRSSNGSYNG